MFTTLTPSQATPINLGDRLLARCTNLAAVGNARESRTLLERIISNPGMSAPVRLDAHRLLADIHLDAQRFKAARRHLMVILALSPESAEAHFKLAAAVEMDPAANPMRAWKLLRKALRLQRDNPRTWNLLGQVALRLRKDEAALKAFRRAARLLPTDVGLLGEIVEGLCMLHAEEEAENLLRKARFRMGKDAYLQQLWNRFRFQQIREQQQVNRWSKFFAAGEPEILQFVPATIPMERNGPDGEPTILRHDAHSRPAPHATRRGGVRPVGE